MCRHITKPLLLACLRYSALVLSMAMSGCYLGDGATWISGTVVDDSGAAVGQATVTLAPSTKSLQRTPAWTQVTRDDGAFQITRSHSPVAGQFELRVTKEGFVPYSMTVEAGDSTANNILSLKRVEPKVPISQAVPDRSTE